MQCLRTIFLSFAVAVLTTGCSLMAPQYSASLDNVQKLKNAGNYTTKVGEFTADKNTASTISLRGNSMSSPYQDSYAHYLKEAIKQELSLANKLGSNADVEVSGVLMKNDIDATGFNTGIGEIQARFVVKKGNETRYDQMKSVRHEWPSSFAGPVAIPRASQEYPNLVQKLLAALYADRAFLDALK